MPKSWDGSVVSALDGFIKFLSGLIQKPTLQLKDSQQSRRNFDERVLSIFVAKMTLILTTVEDWEMKEICTKGVSNNK